MRNPHETPGALRALQDDIYRKKVLRARNQTPEQRMADVFELSNSVMRRMHDGAMWQLGLQNPAEGWKAVGARLNRLHKVHDQGRFVSERKANGAKSTGPRSACLQQLHKFRCYKQPSVCPCIPRAKSRRSRD